MGAGGVRPPAIRFGFHSGNVGIASRMTTAATIGRKVRVRDHALIFFLSDLDINHRPHGTATDRTAIQNTSTTKLDRDTVDPMLDTPRGNHAITPVNG